MHKYLTNVKDLVETQPELFIGEVIKASIHEGLKVEAVQVSEEPFLDIGTGDDLLRAVKRCIAGVN
jgi:dTDP-glucose pyrophosphorylase